MKNGVEIIKNYLKNLSNSSGVYQMIDEEDNILYVGKAKNLKNRVSNYVNLSTLGLRITKMVTETCRMEFITTHTEVEALLLEANMIKRLSPKYNILLRDDKSFPYILIDNHEAPRVRKHRGAKKSDGHYFGPFASVNAVNASLTILQKTFFLRTCSDSVYHGRSRPCLLYQIKRCAAPCVGKISLPEYSKLVTSAHEFLSGRSYKIKDNLTTQMQQASAGQDYEKAAIFRDRLKSLAAVQSRQDINQGTVDNADVIAAYQTAGQTSVQIFFFRAGQNWGNKAYFPRHAKDQNLEEVLAAFLSQFYDNKPTPNQILLSHVIPQQELIEEALCISNKKKIILKTPLRGEKLGLINMAVKNAREALEIRLAENASQQKLLRATADTFDLDAPPTRIEIYDNSHISGAHALGCMVVSGTQGFVKNAYRKFNIKSKEINAGDDFGMMKEVLKRRFTRQIKEKPNRDDPSWPDLLIIDGGKGQLSAVIGILEDLGIEDLPVVAIAKGPDRNAGREDFYMPSRKPFKLPPNDPVLFFLQRLRDEAHRFAIGSHRQSRAKNMYKSILDGLPNVGSVRKKALLLHFGSAKSVENSALSDLEKVKGISKKIAQNIYDYFHDAP